MKRLLADRTALSLAAVGFFLMIFTLLWRTNPIEGSVIPRFGHENPLGVAVFCVLFVTCMPAYIADLLLMGSLLGEGDAPSWLPEWFSVFNLLALVLQAIIWFLLSKLVSVGLRKLAGKNQPKAVLVKE